MVVCLTGVRFNMKADILRAVPTSTEVPPEEPETEGHWETTQDPDSGETIRTWVPGTVPNPNTDDPDDTLPESFACIARGIVDGGIRVAGTTERFGELYENVDYVSMTVGPHVNITKRDRVTNIRSSDGIVLWRNEEEGDPAPATVFNVMGVTPIPDPFGKLIEQRVMLERAERQQ